MPESIDCAVIGAGVIGLGVARALALKGLETVILEAGGAFGTGVSSRNSEVIHAGIYYPPGGLKARLCVAGKEMLYAYCASRGIGHRRCAKLIVATEADEQATLKALLANAEANGVNDLELLSAAAAHALEPNLDCKGALLSPSTGILDSHALMLSLLGEAEANGAAIAYNSPVTGGGITDGGGGGVLLEVGGAAPMTLHCRHAVNCAGLQAQRVASAIRGLKPEFVPTLHLAKGSYFYLPGRAPFSRLIYPAPGDASLGMHFTLDLGGLARFGPDVEWVEVVDYEVDESRAPAFEKAIRRYWPGLPDGALQPGYAGIRPKIQAPGEPVCDFVIQGEEVHGVKGLINLFGIESPGLTATLAIAEEAAAMVE
ncbi:MAG TPA: NAD(P)/FAD-dependent oxidoreductase [Rhodospirillales bacterium]|nr:NAD(P)/FAD-dependent oxidoreductase [Rhodospirillales bacterium]